MRPAELDTTGGTAAEITRLSPRLCHATRDDISIAGSPPTGEDDGLGDFCKNDELSSGMAGQLYSRAAEQDR